MPGVIPIPCPACGTPLPPGVRPEFCPQCLLRDAAEDTAILAKPSLSVRCVGDYELLEEIARGGMGVVFRARQRSLGRIVAVKLLLGGHFASETARARFQEEAAAAAALQHPNIVAIHESGEQDGLPYFSMDFIEGRTLADLVRDGPILPARAAQYVTLATRAIAHGHAHGILHRDLKPSNVLIDAFDQPRVTDFGLAKRLAGSTPDLTATGQVLGTPAYTAPEQSTAGASHRSDVYSLGALLYHLLTGRAPFQGDSVEAILTQVAGSDPIPPRQLNPSVPRDLENICLRCLEKDPGRRYASANDLADDLDRFLSHAPVHARPIGLPSRLWRWSRRHRGISVLISLLTLVLAGSAIGATLVANRIAHAERTAREGLRTSLLNEARALRLRADPLARADILARVSSARDLGLDPGTTLRARAEAAAAAALPIVTYERHWALPPDASPERVWMSPDAAVRFEVIGTNSVRIQTLSGTTNWILTGSRVVLAIEEVSPDLTHVLLRHPEGVGIWSLSARSNLFQGARPLGAATFSPRGNFAVVEEGHDGLVVIDLPEATIRSRPRVPDPIPNGDRGWAHLSVSPNGAYIAGGRVRTNVTDILRVTDGRHLARLPHAEPVTATAWHPTTTLLATGTRTGRTSLWRYLSANPSEWQPSFTLPGTEGSIIDLHFNPSGRLLAAATSNRRIHVASLQTRRPVFDVPAIARGFTFDEDGTRLGPILHQNQLCQIQFSNSPVVADREVSSLRTDILGIDTTAPVAATFSYSRGTLLDPRSGRELVPVNTAGTRDFRVHPSGESLFAVDSRGISRWSLVEAGPDLLEVGERWPWLVGSRWHGLSFNREGTRLAVANPADATVLLLDVPRTNVLASFGPHPGVEYPALSPDAAWLATASPLDRRVRIWDTASSNQVLQLNVGDRPRAAFSSNGRWLLASGRTATLLETRSWSGVPLKAPDLGSEISAAAFSPDSTLLAIASSDQEIHLFTLPGASHVLTLHGRFPTRVTALGITHGNATLFACGVEGSIRTWQLDRLRAELRSLQLDWLPAPPQGTAPATPESRPGLRVRIVPQPR